MNWNEQRLHGSRPVTQICWFEARAYAAWLSLQLEDELRGQLEGYSVRVPTEGQWERAARAKDTASSDNRRYPWDTSEERMAQVQLEANLHANIDRSRIDRPSPVGLYETNPLGLCDLIGNVWEWQNTVYRSGVGGRDIGPSSGVDALATGELPEQMDFAARRGGAYALEIFALHTWGSDLRPPDLWDENQGVRVVLSLDNTSTEA